MHHLRTLLTTLFFCYLFLNIQAQDRPRLVVGIVVDQMRYDYLYRYWHDLGDEGFKRLLNHGHVVHDGHYQYAPTYTGPGHASIFSGASPVVHGIASNNWYSYDEQKVVYCVEDPRMNTVGSSSVQGQMSPHRLRSTSLADQLELGTNRRSKTIGIAIKDRGAILPVGFLADGAYWYDSSQGAFITSTYYRNSLPQWVLDFNARRLPDTYVDAGWQTLLPLERYDESLPDDKPMERPFRNTEKARFPYDLKKISETSRFGQGESRYGILLSTPHGNSLTLEFAKAAIVAEQMGQDAIPDLLALSFSSTDYAGHQFGPHSVEIQDIYLRLDLQIADFLDFLDEAVGLNNTLIFLTSDHGAADVPGFLLPAVGYFQTRQFEEGLRAYLVKKTGFDPIENFINDQIYFKHPELLEVEALEKYVREYAATFLGIAGVVSLSDFSRCSFDPPICETLRRGIVPDRSGNLLLLLHPGWISDSYLNGGTTHGSAYSYDTHVPIIFYGWDIAPKNNYRRVWIQDIAPTVAEILKIARPSGSTGQLIEEVFER